MSKPVPWSVDGGGFDAREAVQAAARQAGLGVDQWLAAAVTDYAALLGVAPRDLSEDQRVDAIARKMGYGRSGRPQPARAAWDSERVAAELRQSHPLSQPAPPPAGELRVAPPPAAPARNEVGAMIREVGRRLDALNAAPAPAPEPTASRAARPLAAGDGLEPLRRELTRLVDLMSDMRAPGAASQTPGALRGELATLLDAVADLCREAAEAQSGADAADVADLKRDMRLLRDAIQDVQRAAEPGHERGDELLDDMRREVDEIGAEVAGLEAREEVAALDATLRQLADQVDASRDDGLRAAILGPVDDLLADVRDALEALRRDESLRALEAQVRELRAALEEVAGADSAALDDLGAQIRELRALLEQAPPPGQLDRVEAQLADLTQRLARIAERGPSAAGEQAVLESVEVIRAGLQAGMAQDVFAALEERLAALCARMEQALEPSPDAGLAALQGRLDDMQGAFGAQMERAHNDRAQDAQRLEGLLHAMSERLDQPLTRSQLEQVRDVVGQLAERFGASDAQPQALRALEGRLEDIFARLGEPVNVEFDTSRIEGMIGDIAGRVDATGAVAAQLQDSVSRIAQAIEQLSATSDGGESLRAIEAQIAEITARLDEPVSAELDTSRLEAMVERMGARIDAVADARLDPRAADDVRRIAQMVQSLGERVGSQSDGEALRALERQVEHLGERLEGVDGADSLASLERSVADIFQHIEQFRETALLTAEHAARKAAREALASAVAAPRGEGDGIAQIALEREFADLRAQQRAAEQRTSATLDAVRAMLEKVVDRLALIEERAPQSAPQEIPRQETARQETARQETPRQEQAKSQTSPPQTAPPQAPAVFAPPIPRAPVVEAQPAAECASAPAPAVEPASRAMGADLSDMLLEPGAGKPAQSGLVLPSAEDGAEGPRASFIAAVRRAQTAATGALAEPATAESPLDQARARARAAASKTQEKPARPAPKRAIVKGRMKSLLRACAAVAIIGLMLAVGAKVGLSMLEDAPFVEAPERQGAVAPAIAREPEKSAMSALGAGATAPRLAAQLQQTPAAAQSQQAPAAAAQIQQAPGAAAADPTTVASIDKRQQAARPQDLRSAAASGAPAAQFEMAARYADGRGVGKDLAQAAAWFERAASQEFAPAQYRLGAMYEKGNGVERDLEKAREWYQRAAERGHVKAMHNLAVLIAEGAAGKPDYGTAAQWFRSAAEHGVRDSQYNFAILNARGLGVAQDLVQSYMWFSLAAVQGDEDAARKRADVAARLDARQLSRARQLVDNFAAKRPDQAVNEALAPPGGWEFAPEPAARPARPQAPRPRVSSL